MAVAVRRTGESVLEALDKMGATSGLQVPDFNELNVFCTGFPKVGKTTAWSGRPNNLIIDVDSRGSAFVDVPESSRRINVDSLADLERVLKVLENKRGEINHVTIDTIDRLNFLIRQDLTAQYQKRNPDLKDITEHGQHGKGWDILSSELLKGLRMLNSWGYGHTVLGHMTVGKYNHEGPNGEMVEKIDVKPSLQNGATKVLLGDAAIICRVTRRRVNPKDVTDPEEVEALNRIHGASVIADAKKSARTTTFDIRVLVLTTPQEKGKDSELKFSQGVRVPNMKAVIYLPQNTGQCWELIAAEYDRAKQMLLASTAAGTHGTNG